MLISLKFIFKHRKQGKKINTSNLWSNSLIKDYLVDYAKGLACQNYDMSNMYLSRRLEHNTWLVCSKESLSDNKDKARHGVVFQRIRTVTIDSKGYMSCNCGYVQRMMMPCRHICTVIDDTDSYIPSLFHIRWHKLFYYYYRNQYELSNCQKTIQSLEDIFMVTKRNCYHPNGKYRGVYVCGTFFLEN